MGFGRSLFLGGWAGGVEKGLGEVQEASRGLLVGKWVLCFNV